MKKAVIITTFLLVLNSNCIYSHPENKIKQGSTEVTESDGLYSKVVNAFVTVKNGALAVSFAADKTLDYVLSPKGIVKVTVLLSPVLFYLYYSQNTSILDRATKSIVNFVAKSISENKDSINSIIQTVGNIQGNYEIQIDIGKSQSFWSNVYNNPFGIALTKSRMLFDSVFRDGIPFLCKKMFG